MVVKQAGVRVIWIAGMVLLGLCSACSEQKESHATGQTDIAINQAETAGLVFDPPEIDVGEVVEGKHATARFLIRNNSQRFLSIANIEAPCGCTTGEPETRVLDGGAFTVLEVDIDTFGKTGDVRKSISVIDQYGRKTTAWVQVHVMENPHLSQSERSIFDGTCAACHVAPAAGQTNGREIYKAVCAMCHGQNAKGGYAPDLTVFDDADALMTVIAHGTGNQHMPGFAQDQGGPLDEKQLKSLAQWLISLDGSDR